MTVNNFAPAEYGGYVLGANSGGGGSSPFDEWLGVTDLVTLTINLTMPEGVEAGGEVSVYYNYYDNLEDLHDDYGKRKSVANIVNYTGSMSLPFPLTDVEVSALWFGDLYIPDVGTFLISTIPGEGATYSGGAEFDERTGKIIITGDATINLPVSRPD